MSIKAIYILLFSVLYSHFAFSQSRVELERNRKTSLKEIKYTNFLISETKKNKEHSYTKLLLLNKKINSREDIIDFISHEIKYLDNSIEVHKEIIIGLEKDLRLLRNEYAKIIYHSYLHRSKYDKLMFLLASENINKAFRRLKYLQQYSKYRIEQGKNIENTRFDIGNQIVQLEILKSDKSNLLIEEEMEKQNLLAEKSEQRHEVNKLSTKEHDLKLKLKKQNDIASRLQKEITRIIEEEARLAAEKLNSTNSKTFQLTPEEKLIAEIFSKNKNHLPWPTERGIITGKFGDQPHPVLKGIKIRNNGIDISTTEGSIVRSIYEGTVSRIVAISGAHKTVIIRHKNYLSIYSNLSNVTVKQGDRLKQKRQSELFSQKKELKILLYCNFRYGKEWKN